jgi:hypothetical protein
MDTIALIGGVDDVTMIRIVAGVLFVVVLCLIVWRRKRKVSE